MEKKWTGERLETFVYNECTIEHLHRYAIAKDLVKNKIVLDIACGEGYGANLLADAAKHVTGVDIDSRTIHQAAKKYCKSNLKFMAGRVEHIPLPDHSVDVVVSFETLEHTTEHTKMLQEVKRVLKPGGIAIISTPEKKEYSDATGYINPFHVKELYEHQFTALVRQFFFCSYFLRQNTSLTSLALLHSGNRMKIYEGNYETITDAAGIPALYLIAIASDETFEEPAPSLFMSDLIYYTALTEQEKALKRTITYRTGHIILLPFKLLRNLFRRQ